MKLSKRLGGGLWIGTLFLLVWISLFLVSISCVSYLPYGAPQPPQNTSQRSQNRGMRTHGETVQGSGETPLSSSGKTVNWMSFLSERRIKCRGVDRLRSC